MRVGAVIFVRDDIELLRTNVAYHSTIGVDCFVICDRGSDARSQEQLEELARREDVHLFRQHLYELRDIDAATMRAARIDALEQMRHVFAPDWLFPMDTDEFWVPESGDIRALFGGSGADYLKVRRFNAALTRGPGTGGAENGRFGSGLLDQEIIVKRQPLSRERLEADPATPWVFHAVMPKFATSRRDFVEVAPGFHDLLCSEPLTPRWLADLLIVHFPFTTFERFATKVANARTHLKHVGPTFRGEQAWHWQRWTGLGERESLRAEFERQFFDPDELGVLTDRRVVMKARDYFAELKSRDRPGAAPLEGHAE